MKNLTEEGVEHMMLSWTLGGYMSDNLKIASAFFADSGEEFSYDKILENSYGDYAKVFPSFHLIIREYMKALQMRERQIFCIPKKQI